MAVVSGTVPDTILKTVIEDVTLIGGSLMTITIEATYEDGVLKPKEPLPLNEHETVRVTIDEQAAWRQSRVQATAGLLGWKGDAETVERIALDPEFGIHEAP